MLGSAHDGERAAAAAMADKMIREAGLTWADVITPPDDMPTIIRDCLGAKHRLNEWQRGLFQSIEQRSEWTEKQWNKAKQIWRRVSR